MCRTGPVPAFRTHSQFPHPSSHTRKRSPEKEEKNEREKRRRTLIWEGYMSHSGSPVKAFWKGSRKRGVETVRFGGSCTGVCLTYLPWMMWLARGGACGGGGAGAGARAEGRRRRKRKQHDRGRRRPSTASPTLVPPERIPAQRLCAAHGAGAGTITELR